MHQQNAFSISSKRQIFQQKPNLIFFLHYFQFLLDYKGSRQEAGRRRPSFFTSPEKRCTILENILHSSYSAMIMRKMILVISNWIAASRHRVMYISCFPLDMKCFLFHCHQYLVPIHIGDTLVMAIPCWYLQRSDHHFVKVHSLMLPRGLHRYFALNCNFIRLMVSTSASGFSTYCNLQHNFFGQSSLLCKFC